MSFELSLNSREFIYFGKYYAKNFRKFFRKKSGKFFPTFLGINFFYSWYIIQAKPTKLDVIHFQRIKLCISARKGLIQVLDLEFFFKLHEFFFFFFFCMNKKGMIFDYQREFNGVNFF